MKKMRKFNFYDEYSINILEESDLIELDILNETFYENNYFHFNNSFDK